MSFFGSFGLAATHFLLSLANLELLHHDETLQCQGLDPLVDTSALSQCSAVCYCHITAQLGHAVAKASIMLHLVLPQLPLSVHSLPTTRPATRPCQPTVPACHQTLFSYFV